MLFFLVACFSSNSTAPIPATPTAPIVVSTATAVLWFDSDHGHSQLIQALDNGTNARPVRANAFPAAPDPQGRGFLVIISEGEEDAHTETLSFIDRHTLHSTPLAPSAPAIRNPAWTPDGTQIVFESSIASFRDLYRVNRDGTGLERLTTAKFGSFEPSISDSGRIAFGSSRTGNAEIFTMNLDGTDIIQITNRQGDDYQPRWRPHTEELTWLARTGVDVQIMHRVNGENTPFERSTNPHELVRSHVWSPTGTHLAVTRVVGPKTVIIDLIGDSIHRIALPGTNADPAWSPDGEYLLFSHSAPGAPPNLYRTTKDGGEPTPITQKSTAEWLPRWIPAQVPTKRDNVEPQRVQE